MGFQHLLMKDFFLIGNVYLMNKVIERHLTLITKENNYDIRLIWDVIKIEINKLTIAYY